VGRCISLSTSTEESYISHIEMAVTLEQQGEFSKAEDHCRTAWKQSASLFGAEDPDTVWAMEELADRLKAQSKYAEEEPIRKSVVEARSKALVENHPYLLDGHLSLSCAQLAQDKYGDCLTTLRKILDNSHDLAERLDSPQEMLTGLGILSTAKKSKQSNLQGFYNIPQEVACLRHTNCNDESGHCFCINSIPLSISGVLAAQNKLDEVESYLQQPMEWTKKISWKDATTVRSFIGLFCFLAVQIRPKEQVQLLSWAVELSTQHLGLEDEVTKKCIREYNRCLHPSDDAEQPREEFGKLSHPRDSTTSLESSTNFDSEQHRQRSLYPVRGTFPVNEKRNPLGRGLSRLLEFFHLQPRASESRRDTSCATENSHIIPSAFL
jgi:hypothetical protein